MQYSASEENEPIIFLWALYRNKIGTDGTGESAAQHMYTLIYTFLYTRIHIL